MDTDTDQATGAPAPKPLVPYATEFTTFGPEAIGQTEESFAPPGIVVFDNRGYVATPQASGFGSTHLRIFDVSDPPTPTEVPQESPRWYGGTPVALVGDLQSPLTDEPILALGTARTQIPWGPSNLLLFNVATDVPQWIGAVSVGTSPTDGILQQVVLKGERAYVATAAIGKGIQVIDLVTARDLMTAELGGTFEGNPAYWTFLGKLNTEGSGFGQGAIIQTVFVDTGTQQNSQLYALDFAALLSRLPMACARRAGSPFTHTGRSPVRTSRPSPALAMMVR